ncbi:MAG: transglycosylase SLT domain-containing protein [Pseudomarimonas sp.]
MPLSESVDISSTRITPTSDLNPSIDSNVPTASNVLLRLREQLVEDANCKGVGIEREIRNLVRRPDAFLDKLEHALPLLEYVLTAVEQQNLPGQFALIPWAESGFRADPGNRGSVQGLWQFTESTGRAHGLRIDRVYDGRRATIDSTRAAIEHLALLQKEFSDWRFALLGYNAGAYRVSRAIRNHPLNPAGLPTGLAPHSYIYLQRISALGCVLRDPQLRGLDTTKLSFEPLVEVTRPQGINTTARLAQLSALTVAEFLRFNSAFRNGDVADNAPPTILLPERAARAVLATNTKRSAPSGEGDYGQRAAQSVTAQPQREHVVVRGQNLWLIAKLYGVKLRDLLRTNGLSPRSVIRPGQRIRITPD